MKTATRQTILRIIQSRDGVRPKEIIGELGLTPQAIHRHLKALVSEHLIEVRGRGPLTRYHPAGTSELGPMMAWVRNGQKSVTKSPEAVCETRDVFAGRLDRIGLQVKNGLSESELPLLIAVASEIGNNCFDHNMGRWKDAPGCWFEVRYTKRRIWLLIADRGQGIFNSLTRAGLVFTDEKAALTAAFERTISGRSPERRGNGLKFVRRIIESALYRGVACKSGTATVAYGKLGTECEREIGRFPDPVYGTVTLVLWRTP